MARPQEKPLLDRVKDYASSVAVQETPWLNILMNDIIVALSDSTKGKEEK